jgi:hypothetical protein
MDFGEPYATKLTCTHCIHDCTHHGPTHVWLRPRGEDGPSRKVTTLDNGVAIEEDAQGNPSGRRDAVEIVYSCEECGGLSALQVIQHKGATYLQTVAIPPTEAERMLMHAMQLQGMIEDGVI